MTAGINRDSQTCIYLDYRQRDRPVLHTTLHRHPQLHAHRVWGRSLCRFARTRSLCVKKTHLCVFLRTHNMPDNYVKVLTALGMHSNNIQLSKRQIRSCLLILRRHAGRGVYFLGSADKVVRNRTRAVRKS